MNASALAPRRGVLLVEDDPGDAYLLAEALRRCGADVDLTVARDGQEALALLQDQSPSARLRRPDLILLDLGLPRLDGRQLLSALKADPNLRQIPVVVLSSSEADADVRACYASSAGGYVRKPMQIEALFEVVAALQAFWLRAVTPPPLG